jgi:predicted permease
VETLIHHVRAGLRALRTAPAFAATAILTLALGIGLATAVFTVAESVVIRRLPIAAQERVVVLSGAAPARGIPDFPFDVPDARELVRRSRALRRAAFVLWDGAMPITVRDGSHVSRLRRALVSGDYFDVLGVRPVLGRALRPEDDARGAAPVVVLSHRAWQARYGGAPDVVGRRIVMHELGIAATIVGVMPPGLDWPRGTDVWAPLFPMIPERFLSLHVVGRLAPGATVATARSELTAFYRRPGASPLERELHGVVRPLPGLALGDTRPAVLAFAAAAGLLLLITCIDVANLLLVRALARAREVAVRTALGASRARVVGQLVTEHALLAAAGGLSGVAVAAAAVRAFVAVAPAAVPRLDEVRLDGTALAGALAITALATLLFAVAPAVLASRVDAQQALRAGVRHTAGRRARRLRETLVAAQVALALLVLSAAGLVGRSLLALGRADLAFDPARLVVAELAYPVDGGAPAQIALLERLLPAVRAIPGVRGVSPAIAVPYAGSPGWVARPSAEGQSEQDAARNPLADMEVVAPDFFPTLGLRVLAGRAFTDADRAGAPPVVMLSESAARHLWPGGGAVGRRVVDGRGFATVVGVVPDTRYRDLRAPHGSIYFPLRQAARFPNAPATLLVRAAPGSAPADVIPALRRAVAEVAPEVAVASAAPFDALLAGPLAEPRMNALLLGVFAAAAVTLAGVGLFGVLATMVRQRTRELGVRMALGATAGDVAGLVLRRALLLAAAGTAAGVAGALVTNRLLAALLYGVSPTDAPTLAAAAAALLAVAAAAGAVPARAGRRVDPAAALRAE